MKLTNDGFSISETIVWLFVIFVFSLIVISMGRKTLATSLTGLTEVSDKEIYLAAEKYIEDGHATFDNEYVCISTDTLISSGYLRNTLSKTKYVEAKINRLTKVVSEEHMVTGCNY